MVYYIISDLLHPTMSVELEHWLLDGLLKHLANDVQVNTLGLGEAQSQSTQPQDSS